VSGYPNNIKDDHGEIRKGTFYSDELQKVIKKDDVYKIEMILKKRKKGRRVQYLVKLLGYPDTFNRWIFINPNNCSITPSTGCC
jgi:hypothetical protein